MQLVGRLMQHWFEWRHWCSARWYERWLVADLPVPDLLV
jgi:hypothetical protein